MNSIWIYFIDNCLSVTLGLNSLNKRLLRYVALLLTDSETNCKLLGYLLTIRSIRFCVVSNGNEALSMIKTNPDRFDVIFMDGTMPIMVRSTRQPTLCLHAKRCCTSVLLKTFKTDRFSRLRCMIAVRMHALIPRSIYSVVLCVRVCSYVRLFMLVREFSLVWL